MQGVELINLTDGVKKNWILDELLYATVMLAYARAVNFSAVIRNFSYCL